MPLPALLLLVQITAASLFQWADRHEQCDDPKRARASAALELYRADHGDVPALAGQVRSPQLPVPILNRMSWYRMDAWYRMDVVFRHM